jgi:hypothetical protein
VALGKEPRYVHYKTDVDGDIFEVFNNWPQLKGAKTPIQTGGI